MTVQSISASPRVTYLGLSTDPKPMDAAEWALFIESNTGIHYRFVQGEWILDPSLPGMDGGAVRVVAGSPGGLLVVGEIDDITTTPVRLTPGETITNFYASFRPRGAPVAQELRIVIGADDDTDADTKLATPGARRILAMGAEVDMAIHTSVNAQRIDLASDAVAETGGSKVYWEYLMVDAS